MVSIVICNRGNRISPVLEKNISETIGIEYEVVCIDNHGFGFVDLGVQGGNRLL